MPRRKVFDKKNSTTFSLVYRAQNDPRIHDPEASDMVFAEKVNRNANKIKNRQDLEEEFSSEVRDNEGEAANHGIFYDDSDYDYMQHLRDLGTSGEGHFVEAKQTGKGKQKVGLDEALKDLDLYSDAGVSQTSSRVSIAESLLPDDMLPSEFVQPNSYQNQQDVPDAIAGFQPDMDPRLREVLEALEDEAYVDDDEDIFSSLQREGGDEVDQYEFERYDFDDTLEDDEGWESDRTVKAKQESEELIPEDIPGAEGLTAEAAESNDAWLDEFDKFKKDKDTKTKVKVKPGTIPADLQSSVQTGVSSIAGLKRKKRKGALTSTSGYSMTSSVLRRTDQLSTLDERFERIQEQYADDEAHEFDDDASAFSGLSRLSGVSRVSAMSQVSNAPGASSQIRPDFDNIMDEFLGSHSIQGSRRVRRGRQQSGLEQLDEIRNELGRPRVAVVAASNQAAASSVS